MLYRAGTQIAELREIGFPTEKAMQKFCEKNMDALRLEYNSVIMKKSEGFVFD